MKLRTKRKNFISLHIAQYVVASSLSNDKFKRQETIARIKWIDFIPEQDFVMLLISRDLLM